MSEEEEEEQQTRREPGVEAAVVGAVSTGWHCIAGATTAQLEVSASQTSSLEIQDRCTVAVAQVGCSSGSFK